MHKNSEEGMRVLSAPKTQDQLPLLIAGSDKYVRESIVNYLGQSSGSEILQAETSEQARNFLNNQNFSCVFLDSFSKDQDSLSILKEFYNAEQDVAVAPIIMLCGEQNEVAMLDALRNGAQDYIMKEHLSSVVLNASILKARDLYRLKSDRSRAEQQLQHMRRMEAIGQLTSGIAHDFNNLLTVVLGNTRLLRRRISRDADNFSLSEADKKIESIEIAAAKGADLVRRMMIFTRQSQLSEEIADVNHCVAETFELLKRTLGEPISIEIIPGANIWPISIDIREFENAIINLAVNARDAMPKGGKLTIETSNVVLDEAYTLQHPEVAAGPYVLISISDTGTGIAPDILKRIFEPFFTTKETGQGTGLGLSMVYGFIRQSRGHIHVYSEEGHGTVFRIYLPRVRIDDLSEDLYKDNNIPDGRETILVAEDDEDVRIMASNMLEKLGYRVLQAENAGVALEIMKKQHKTIDLIFSDIVMPGGMSGIELVQRLREYYPDIKVLYTSGYTENAIPDYQLSVGEELISKPYRRENLARKVRKVLDSKESCE